jgi:putative membrane protein
MPPNDPRVFFAAERTLLAWVRTGLALIGLGFVVARFGLFLRLVRPHPDGDAGPHWPTAVLGVVLSVLGSGATAVAAWQHRRFCRTLGPDGLPPTYRREAALVLGFGVAAVGVVLAVEMVL